MPSPYPLFPDEPLSVSDLTEQIKEVLELEFPAVAVFGEISNFARAGSGHCYFSLSDERAQLKAVMWRSTAQRVPFELHDGLEVICHGSIDLYAPRGTYQLVVREILPRGMGAQELALRQLKLRLEAEGLFDPARKRPLPPFPLRIAVVTSPQGAAVRDFLQVVARRWPHVEVLIVGSRVQGEGAPAEIVRAIQAANRLRPAPDCLVLTRGGGSQEDLGAFNDERVVRAIAGSARPVVSAVGHEIDVTLSDLAADVRALTPTEAAELIAPDRAQLRDELEHLRRRLAGCLHSRLMAAKDRLASIAQRRAFLRPLDGLRELSRRADELEQRARLAARRALQKATHVVQSFAARLESLSPLAVLGRGYSLTRTLPARTLVRDAGQLAVGGRIITRFARGEATSLVEIIHPAADSGDTPRAEGYK
jgi:exodeoxyribonuclease VII large subunit